MDIGATRTVIGSQQAVAYSRLADVPLSACTDKPANFLFKGVVTPSVSQVTTRVPHSPKHLANMRVDVVDVAIPFLFGLDALDRLGLYVNNIENRLKCDRRRIATPLTRKDGHIHLERGAEIFHAVSKLDRPHRLCNHPHPNRLTALLRRAGDANALPGTRAQLERLFASCDVCQRLSRAPGRFRVAFPPDEIVFNWLMLIDLMFLDSRSMIHIVDRHTLLSAAAVAHGEKLEEQWQLYPETWVQPYVGHPQVVHVDQAPQLASPIWRALTRSAGTDLAQSGVESHNTLAAGERHHAFLRTIYRKVRADHLSLPQAAALSTAVPAMNQTTSPRGLVPTLLVFGIVPRMPVAPMSLPAQRERMQAIVAARQGKQV